MACVRSEPAHPKHHYTIGRSTRELREKDKAPNSIPTTTRPPCGWERAPPFSTFRRGPGFGTSSARTPLGRASRTVRSLSKVRMRGKDAGRMNSSYFGLLARCSPGLTIAEIDATILNLILGLPGEAFLDVTAIFLRQVDTVYFSDAGLEEAQAVHIRTVLARNLMKTRDWEWQRRERSDSITVRLGPAVAVVLFNDYGSLNPAKCYLYPTGIGRMDPFLPPPRRGCGNGHIRLCGHRFAQPSRSCSTTVALTADRRRERSLVDDPSR